MEPYRSHRVEPNPCGICIHFQPENETLNGEQWGRCAVHRAPRLTTHRVVIFNDERSCFQQMSAIGLSGHRLTLFQRAVVMMMVGATVVGIAFAVEFLTR